MAGKLQKYGHNTCPDVTDISPLRMMTIYDTKKPAPCFENRARLFIISIICHSKDKIHEDADEALRH